MRKKNDPAKEELRQLKRDGKALKKGMKSIKKELKSTKKDYKHKKVEFKTGSSYAAHVGKMLSLLVGVGTIAALIGSRVLEKQAEAELAFDLEQPEDEE